MQRCLPSVVLRLLACLGLCALPCLQAFGSGARLTIDAASERASLHATLRYIADPDATLSPG